MFSITSAGQSELPLTVGSSSSSSSALLSCSNGPASPSPTETTVCGRQASFVPYASPSACSSAFATSWSESTPVHTSWPSSVDCTSSAPASSEIGRAPVRTPVTTAHLVCRLLLAQKTRQTRDQIAEAAYQKSNMHT